MTRLGMVGMSIVTAMVIGCAAKQQPEPPPLRIVHEAPPPAPAATATADGGGDSCGAAG